MSRKRPTDRVACIVVALALAAGCFFRQSRINSYSLSFMGKDDEKCYAAKSGYEGTWRVREAVKLARLGAFRRGMSPGKLRGILGQPTFVWNDVPAAIQQAEGFDLRYVYQLSVGRSLRAEFSDGRLERVYKHDEKMDDPEGTRTPLKLGRPRG